MICSRCRAAGKQGMNFCNECGGTLEEARDCTGCGALVRAAATFCPACGAKIPQKSAASFELSRQQALAPPASGPSETTRVPLNSNGAVLMTSSGKNRRITLIIGIAAIIVILAAAFIFLPKILSAPVAPVSSDPAALKATNLAWALNAKGKFSDAVAAADTAISRDPAVADGYAMKGWALTGLGRHAEALVQLDKALSLDSNNAITWSNKGFALMNLGRCPEAVTAFDRALSLDPYDYGAKKYREKASTNCPVKL